MSYTGRTDGNAHAVRVRITADMWEHINST